MAVHNLPGGQSGTSTNAFVGFRGYQSTITIPAGPHQTVNGHFPILITSVAPVVGGGANTLTSNQSSTPAYVSRNITVSIDGTSTAVFTIAGGPPVLQAAQGISKYYSGATNATYIVLNGGADQYLRYGWQPTSGYVIHARNSTNTGVNEPPIRNPGAVTGYFNYVYAPNNPSNLAATATTATSISLSWSAPSNNGESAITGYRLERSTVSNFSSSVTATDLGTTRSTTVSNLLAGTTYFFRIAAKNAVTNAGSTWSAYSNTLTKRATPSTPTLTVSRTGLVYSFNGSSTITSGSISSYEVSERVSSDGGNTFADWTVIQTLSGTTYSSSLTSIPARSYQIRVRAISNHNVFGEYSTSSILHTPNVPLIPVEPVALTKNVRKVNVDWDTFRTNSNAIALYDGAIISGYEIEAQYSSDAISFSEYENIASTNSETTVLLTDDLLIAKTYRFRIRANSDVGFSSYQESPVIFVSAYGSRATDPTSFIPIENAKIFLGIGQPGADEIGWKIIENVKRFDGTAWTDLQT